jgi:zinc transport system ATP-binding protein
MNKIISIRNVCFEYQVHEVLHKVSGDIERGDYVALVGENGSGKTTLIKIILGLLKPKHGTVKIFGEPIKKFHDWSRIGYLPQSLQMANRQFPATVYEIIAEGAISKHSFFKKLSHKNKEQITSVARQMNLLKLLNRPINNLSGGQWQRVLLARALVNKPELLILDEPSNTLDSLSREQFFTYLKKLNQENKTTIILITHDIGTVGNYANKLLYVDKTVQFFGKFSDFCHSGDMQKKFGPSSQHLICHQH